MEIDDKRDLMAAIIIQSVMVDKLKWLGDHKRQGGQERLEGLLDDSFRDLITGSYVLVDEMLKRREVPVPPKVEKKASSVAPASDRLDK